MNLVNPVKIAVAACSSSSLVCPCLSFELQLIASKVDQQSNFLPRNRETIYELNLVLLDESASRLTLSDNARLDDEVSFVIAHDFVLIEDSKSNIAVELDSALPKLERKRIHINSFEETRP